MAVSEGLYEFRSILDTTMALDVAGGSMNNSANIQLYSANDSNAQAFYVDESDTYGAGGFTVRNIKSGKYMAVSGSTAASGTNVIQYDFTGSQGQHWRIIDTGETVTVGIETCKIVRVASYVTNDADTYYLDVSGAMTTNKTNVQIWNKNSTDAQVFAMYPTVRTDDNLPQPSFLGMASSLGGVDWSFIRGNGGNVYPGWLGTQSWASNTTNGFRWRYERRYMDAVRSVWGGWQAVSPWYENTGITRDGQTWWVTAGLPATYDTSTYKAMQYELVILSFAGTTGNRDYSPALWCEPITIATTPHVTISNFAFGAYGLRIPYTSDYDKGMTRVVVVSIYDMTTGETLLDKELSYEFYDSSGTIFIPTADLSGWINDGDRISVRYVVGSDMLPVPRLGMNTSAIVTYNAGTITPTITTVDGRRLKVEVDADVAHVCWLYDGVMHEEKVENGIAYVTYPFGEFELFVSAMNGDVSEDDWGLYHATMAAGSGILAGQKPCHAWSWDGNYFLLEYDTDLLSTERSIEPLHDVMALNSREYQNVYFQGPIKSEFSATGLLYGSVSESTKAQMFELARAHHVTYRAPAGEIAEVAVVGVSYEEQRKLTKIEVTMVEETR